MTSSWQRWKGIMKAYPFEEKRLMKWHPPYIVQPKYDGFRCRAVPLQTGIDSNYLLLSSEENIFYSVPHILKELTNTRLRAELDGELYHHDMNFNELSSILSRTVNLHNNYNKIEFHIFDIINDQPQMKRLLLLENLRKISPSIKIAPFWLCETYDEVVRVYDKVIESGYEGIIVRHFQAPYQRKRSTLMMKFKPKKSDDYEIIGWKEEYSVEGVAKGRLGALVCRSGDGDVFSVGTGFSDDQRVQLWDIRESLLSSFARVQYQHLTAGRQVPRHSVFVEIINTGTKGEKENEREKQDY